MKYFDHRVQFLRALAIALVVMAHTQVPYMSAGFLGVDIFFVISGYLVVGNSWLALQQKNFSVTNFLLARAWRLFPAAAVSMLLVLLIFGGCLLPDQWHALGRSLAVSVAGLENIFLWRGGNDYFSAAIQEQPLMHLWSLAVEGQFYLALTLLAICCSRWQWPLRQWIIALFIISIGCWAWGWLTHPVAAYYFLPTRGWEFMAGALVALHPARRVKVSWWIWAMSLILLGMLGLQTVLLKPLLQLLAVGIAIFYMVGPQGIFNERIGKSRLVQWVAEHAYVLYLVHWPIWVWYIHSSWWSESRWPTWTWLPMMITIAAALHFLIEKPGISAGQYWRSQPLRRRVLCLAALAFIWLTIGLLGFSVWYAEGWPKRLTEVARNNIEARNDLGRLPERCMMSKVQDVNTPLKKCMLGNGELSTIIWGDSHAAALMSGWPASGPRVMLLSAAGCPAWLGMPWKFAELCRGLNKQWLPMVLKNNARDVYLVGRWGAYWNARGYGFTDSLQPSSLTDSQNRELSSIEMRSQLIAGLHATVEALVVAGKQVTIVGPVPELNFPAPECYGRKAWNNPSLLCDEPWEKVRNRLMPVERALQALVKEFPAGQVHYVSSWPAFCDKELCHSAGPEGIYYYDDDHLSATGARHLVKWLGIH